MNAPSRNDQILPVTRWVALLVIPFLVLAFIILYFFPQLSGERFAWGIKPDLMDIYMGSGYLGGAYLFLHAVIGHRWHRVAMGFPAVTGFTIAMLLATVLHWERFNLSHLPFQIWLVLYVVTPFLVPWLWWRNRQTDTKEPEPDDLVVPTLVRWAVRSLGVGLSFIAVAGFIVPALLMNFWSWTLSPLTARVLAGWGALLGIGNLAISLEPRFSGWKVGMGSIAIWHVLFLIGAYFHRQDFISGNWLNWYTVSIMLILGFIAILYIVLENIRFRR